MVELARKCEDCGDARTVVIRVLKVDYVALVTPSVEKMPGPLISPTPGKPPHYEANTDFPIKMECVPLWPW
jgi:hypothetical protein